MGHEIRKITPPPFKVFEIGLTWLDAISTKLKGGGLKKFTMEPVPERLTEAIFSCRAG